MVRIHAMTSMQMLLIDYLLMVTTKALLPYKVFLYRRSDNGGGGMIFLLLHVVTNSLRRSKRNANRFRHRHPTAGNGSCKFGMFSFSFFVCIISNIYL